MKTAITITLITTIMLITAGCAGPEPKSPELAITGDVPQIFNNQQVDERKKEYLAIHLWAEAARQKAIYDPDNFGQAMTSPTAPGNKQQPDQSCVELKWDLLQQLGSSRDQMSNDESQIAFAQWLTTMLNCQEQQFQETAQYRLTKHEQDQLIDDKTRILWRSISPAEYMSARLAQEQAANVTVKNSPSFTQFTQNYEKCEQTRQAGYLAVANAPTTREAADAFLKLDEDLKECAQTTTESIFAPVHDDE